MISFDLDVAGLAVHLRMANPDLAEMIRKRYQRFSAKGGDIQMVCDLDWRPRTEGQAGSVLNVNFTPEGLTFEGAGSEGKVDLPEGRAVFHSEIARPESAVEYFLRLVYALLVFDSGGIMLHGAGIRRSGKTAVFFGNSGSGKTTVSRLSGEENVLNDDLLVLLPEDSGWLVAATPFWNPTQVQPSVRQAPLGGLFRLVQDRRVYLQPARPAAALAELVSSTPVINADPVRMPEILERLARLNNAYPVQFLHFLPDTSFWQVVDMNMGSLA